MMPRLPAMGFGCSPFRAGGRRVDLTAAVRTALAAGYRLFDLAELYGNERAVGEALASPEAPRRRELFVVGKAWRTNFRPAALRAACEGSLRRLGCDAFDLYLLHAPEAWRHNGPLDEAAELGWDELERRAVPRDAQGNPEADDVPPAETWGAMQDLVRRGLAAAVGVSNFAPAQIASLGLPLPAADQIEHSPYQPNSETVAWCAGQGIRLMAHSPLSAPGLLAEPRLAALAASLRLSPAQVVLRWNVQRGLAPLPSSTDPGHIAENLRALDFELDADAMATVAGSRVHGVSPGFGRASRGGEALP
jgi:diketogulonate reductase-like aldo/keto reductase